MLALTHHVIVRYAALKGNIINFSDYCVLGDDIVIADDTVADNYLEIMKHLGVAINRSKSVESVRFTEFAKTLLGPHTNITPLGPGLILQAVRNKFYLLQLLEEGIKTNLFPD